MNQIQNETTKTAKQAWRKHPRRFAPKSRLGCKTCKIRRVKCDLSQPSCLKCKSTGRACDGYTESLVASDVQVKPNEFQNTGKNSERIHDIKHSHIEADDYRQERWREAQSSVSLQSLGPLLVLPVIETLQPDAMRFFEDISVRNLNEYQPSRLWRKTLMLFSQTVPSVRYAAVALALLHRNYLDGNIGNHAHGFTSYKTLQTKDQEPLIHYNRAIQELLNQEAGDSTEKTAITLLVCYLFTCFDHLAGNDVQAMNHLRGGLELVRNIDKARVVSSDNSDSCYDSKIRNSDILICQVISQIRRLDRQAVMFLLDWTPTDIQDTTESQISPSTGTLRSLEQAADQLQILVGQVMRLRSAQEQMYPTGKVLPQPSPSSAKSTVLEQLERWSALFETMVQQKDGYNTPVPDAQMYTLIKRLRLQHTIAWIFLSSLGPGREMEYDKFLPQFQQGVALARDIATAHEQHSGSLKPTFTPEMGFLPAVYIIGAKCRHPATRREVLNILRRQNVREAVWDSMCTARVLERVIEIEEEGWTGVPTAQRMHQIPAWQRIENLTWIRSMEKSPLVKIDLTYTFSTLEGAHTENLTYIGGVLPT